ncbi:MAG: TolC family protein [Verrucomicrobiota bacterium]
MHTIKSHFLVFISCIAALVASAVAQSDEFTIAIINDGESWYYDRSKQLLVQELQELAKNSYQLTIKDDSNGDYNAEKIEQLLRQAIADPEVDLVYTSGVIASERAAKLSEADRSKPVLAGSVFFSNLRSGRLTQEGVSNVKNYTFISEPNRVGADFMRLMSLRQASKVHVLVDEAIFPELASIDETEAAFEQLLGVTLEPIEIPVDPQAALRKVPASARVAYIPILPRMNDDQRRALFDGLADRGVLTLSMAGEEDVLLGAIAGQAPDDSQAVARRAALSAHRILNGANPNAIPVVLPVADNFVINARAAQRANWSPTYDVMLEADIIGEFESANRPMIDLHKAMELAAKQNTGVIIAREEEVIIEQDTKIIRSNLLPSVSTDIAIQRSESEDNDNSGASSLNNNFNVGGQSFNLSAGATNTRSYGADVRQVLFNDELRSSLKAQRKNELATKLDTRSEELDAMDEVASGYFDYLEANRLYQIEKQNLRLTESNFQLAKLRIEIGSAEPSEQYRWEQAVAADRATLIQRQAQREIALADFNRILAMPREMEWEFEEIFIDNDDIYFLDDQLSPMLNNLSEFRRFRTFVLWYAVQNSPELASFDEALSAQGILLRQKQRSFFMPELNANVGFDRIAIENDLFDLDGQNSLSTSVSFSYNIFEGGSRKAEVIQQKGEIRQLAAQREQAVQQLEIGAIVAFENLGAAHPQIRLSRMALAAAEKNYDSVREKYAQGSASILDLLDAQDSLLSQQQNEASAVYGYLDAIHELQRSLAWFEFEQEDAAKSEFVALVKKFLDGGVPFEHVPTTPRQLDAAKAVRQAQPIEPKATSEESLPKPTETEPKKKRGFRLFKKKANKSNS